MYEQENMLFEEEQEEDLQEDIIPENERRLVTQAFDFTVKSLTDQIEDKTITVDENWQRKYVWDDIKASRLIESLLLNVPIPVCYFAEETSGEYLVIDGQQRLWSIFRYLTNQFPLKGLKTLAHLNKKRFFELDQKEQRFIKSRTIRCIALTQESHPEIRFDVFERLNTGSVSLNPQELRHCMYRGPFNNLLSNLSKDKTWLRCLRRDKPDDRFRDQELILRFFAFHFGIKTYRPSLSRFLNDFMRSYKKISPQVQDQLESLFKSTVEKVYSVFGEHSFRRLIKTDGQPEVWDKNINKALFDLEMLLCSHITTEEYNTRKTDIEQVFKSLMIEPNFIDLITRSTDHRSRVHHRLYMLCKKLGEINLSIPDLCSKVDISAFQGE